MELIDTVSQIQWFSTWTRDIQLILESILYTGWAISNHHTLKCHISVIFHPFHIIDRSFESYEDAILYFTNPNITKKL